MTSSANLSWPVVVVPVGAVSVGAVAFRRSGKLSVSAIVKATFSFSASAALTPALPVPLRTAEQPHEDSTESSIREPLDTVPLLPRADVLFAGHACAPGGTPLTRMTVRLALRLAKGDLLIDKPLEVLGDRLVGPVRGPVEPASFRRMPMIYERAYGGTDHKANPVGMGQLTELAGRRRLPNIVHPDRPPRPAIEPAGFAPISFRWHVRRRMLLSTPRHALELPIAEIPGELAPSYFQAAPADQQTSFLQGDEWIVLEGLNPVHEKLEMQLPGARGVARVYLPDGSSQPIALVADMLFIDGDSECCSITWRGSFPLASEADLPATGVAAGVELPGRPVALPDRLPQLRRALELKGLGGELPAVGGQAHTVVFDAKLLGAGRKEVAAAAPEGKESAVARTQVLGMEYVPPSRPGTAQTRREGSAPTLPGSGPATAAPEGKESAVTRTQVLGMEYVPPSRPGTAQTRREGSAPTLPGSGPMAAAPEGKESVHVG